MQKKFRLKKNDDFKRLIQAKSFVSNKSLTIYFQPNDCGYSRFGISVGKKHGNAVVRNKIKRQLRMMIAKVFEYKYSYDYVIMVRPDFHKNIFSKNLEMMMELAIIIKKRCKM